MKDADREVEIPGTSARAWLRLLTRGERAVADKRARDHLRDCALPRDAPAPAVYQEYRDELALQVVSSALHRDDRSTKFLDVEALRAHCTDLQIGVLWGLYQDLEAELDTASHANPLAGEAIAAIEAAAKKGSVVTLMSFGSAALAHYVTTSAARPQTSLTPKS